MAPGSPLPLHVTLPPPLFGSALMHSGHQTAVNPPGVKHRLGVGADTRPPYWRPRRSPTPRSGGQDGERVAGLVPKSVVLEALIIVGSLTP